MNRLTNWLAWCWEFKTIVPWSVGLISSRELTEEEYNYPITREFPQEFFDEMEKIVEAVETTDFDMDKVETIDIFGEISKAAKQALLDMDKTDTFSHERTCKHCGKVYSTIMCPCVEDRYEF